MENEINFFIPIDPRPQERLRFHFRGSGKRRQILPYIPEKTRDYQNEIRTVVREYMEDHGVLEYPKDIPIYIGAIFYLPRPKSAKARVAPIVRPDLSNYFKALEDGMQRAVKDDDPALLEDDSAVCKIECQKRYVCEDQPEPGVLVTVAQWDPDADAPPCIQE